MSVYLPLFDLQFLVEWWFVAAADLTPVLPTGHLPEALLVCAAGVDGIHVKTALVAGSC